ncbi:FimB/Mfa2 family fimbrial subunit [Bacteroides sp. ET71]|uniref:FimB/Mfa2 family fimbrial subunit n=1 Tax=Bacteroides sp. ET71 TaxID=2939421 RepID=UPI0020126F9B|nr:FimB/Mfa2 family fimbrial subunit [Bacteroides sp. ET71]MCL1615830.1 FimB/Mfa2 family fimbrial subunit [Bacteroides sp. ET71]
MRQNTSYIAWTVEKLRTLCKARKVLSASTRFFILNSSFFILLSCSIMDDGPDALSLQDGSTAQVAFTLKLDKAQPATRTTRGDNYPNKPGTDYENRIDQLQVVLYSTDGNNAAYPLYNLWQETSSTQEGGQDTYTFVGSIDTNDADSPQAGTYKIMVFANCGEMSDYAFDGIDELLFNYRYDDATHTPTTAIPMWGVTTAELTLKPGERQTLDNGIDLLRAVAKIEVVLGDTPATEYTITDITLNHRNTTGYCLPYGWSTVGKTTDLEREGNTPASFHPYASLASSAGNFAVADNKLSAAYYLPEYAKSDANPAQLTITLAKDGNKTKDYTLDLKGYTTDNGGYYDLVRNHIYRYTITGVQDGTLTVQYLVLPWELVSTETGWPGENNVVFYQLLPSGGESGNYQKGDADAVYGVLSYPRYADGEENTVLRSGKPGARFQFTLSKPDGVVWTAHLSNTEDFEFSYSEDNGQHMVSTGISRDEPYYIQINPKHPWTVWPEDAETSTDFDARLTEYGQRWETEQTVPSTYFYITASLDGEHEVELNINPTSDNSTSLYKEGRRFPGTDTRIWIRQLRAVQGWGFVQLAQNVDPTSPDFKWWRVNPYWGN